MGNITAETVVSRRRGSRRMHYVQVEWDAEGRLPPVDEVATKPAVCGQKPPPAGWIIVEEGLDHPTYGRTHIVCDRCFDRFVGPQH